MTKFELDPSKLVVNDVDLSGWVDHIKPMSKIGDEDEMNLHMKLAGLKGASMTMTFDNSQGRFEPSVAAYTGSGWPAYAMDPPLMQVTYSVPDGRWQRFKQRLKRFRPFRWLKVRTVDYSFTGTVKPWPDSSGFTTAAVGPMTKGTETR